MERRHAIVTWDGKYICPNCFRSIGSLANVKPIPPTCKHCEQPVSCDPERDYETYIRKNRLEQPYIRSHGHGH